MGIWKGRDSLHLAHCTSLLKAGICCRNREVVLVCEHGAGGSFLLLCRGLMRGREAKEDWADGRREGARGRRPPKAVKGFVLVIVAANEASASGFISA